MRRRLLAVVLLALALSLAACSGPDDSVVEDMPLTTPPPTEDDTAGGDTDGEASSGEAAWTSCTNPEAGYTVEYPGDWYVNDEGQLDPCQVFDPEPLDLPEQPRELSLGHAVLIRMEPIAFEDATRADLGAEVVEREDVEVDGRRAVRQERLGTGDALIPEDVAVTQYAVDVDGQTLLAVSYDIGEPAYERKVEVLDEMMASLTFESTAGRS